MIQRQVPATWRQLDLMGQSPFSCVSPAPRPPLPPSGTAGSEREAEAGGGRWRTQRGFDVSSAFKRPPVRAVETESWTTTPHHAHTQRHHAAAQGLPKGRLGAGRQAGRGYHGKGSALDCWPECTRCPSSLCLPWVTGSPRPDGCPGLVWVQLWQPSLFPGVCLCCVLLDSEWDSACLPCASLSRFVVPFHELGKNPPLGSWEGTP